jgi:hypothetical protein
MQATRGRGCIAPTHSWPWQEVWVSGQHHILAALYLCRRTPGTHWVGGWADLKAGLDTEARGKILRLCWGLNPFCSVCSQTLNWTELPQLCFCSWTFFFNMGPTIRVPVMAHHTLLSSDREGHFCSLSPINIAPVPIVVSIDMPTQMEPSFIGEKCRPWVKKFRIVFWDVLPCKMIVNRCFRGAYCLHHQWWVSLARKDRGYIGVQGLGSQSGWETIG